MTDTNIFHRKENLQPFFQSPASNEEALNWAKEVGEEYECGEFLEWEEFKLSMPKYEYS